jgi:hypothetical protein
VCVCVHIVRALWYLFSLLRQGLACFPNPSDPASHCLFRPGLADVQTLEATRFFSDDADCANTSDSGFHVEFEGAEPVSSAALARFAFKGSRSCPF